MVQPEFNAEQLRDFNLSKRREVLMVNDGGAYCSTTISTCNTRKYHGLLVVPQPKMDEFNHVLLSCVDESIVMDEKEFPLAVHEYPGVHHPKGHLLLENFVWKGYPQWTYHVDGMTVVKEMVLDKKDDRIFIKYSFSESGAILRLSPFIACRNVHALRQADGHLEIHTELVDHGMMVRMPGGYSPLYFQTTSPAAFDYSPDWYRHIEYLQEKERGYDYHESLFVPGYLEIKLDHTNEVILCVGTKVFDPEKINRRFNLEKKSVKLSHDLDDYLENAAAQFITKRNRKTEVMAGWHWFGRWGRDTFIALPGLTLATKQPKLFEAVIVTMLKDFRNGMFPNTGKGNTAAYNAVDTSLWFIRALQQYTDYTGKPEVTWKHYHKEIASILENYKTGLPNVKMRENGLLWAEEPGKALTWMDAIVDGQPVTQRNGFAVEINALWYNAICFALGLAEVAGNISFIREWNKYPSLIEKSFPETFWNEEKQYLADCVHQQYTDWSVRPNQIIAVALPFSPVSNEIALAVIKTTAQKLLTMRGLQTLASDDWRYRGTYYGSQRERDLAYHQGTVWPWLLGYYAEACFRVKGKEAFAEIKFLYHQFEPALFEYGIGTIAEVYNGDEPYVAGGCIAQAWSVAELLRVRQLLRKYKHNVKAKNHEASFAKTLVTINL